jgi:hypothetical protein
MSAEDKPKIIVDDDWKTRVQAEKEALRSGDTPPVAENKATHSAKSKPDDSHEPLPPATFESLVSLFVTQALAALGQIPMGDKQQPVIMLDHAKHYIDLLAILETKTKGNLSADETEMLTRILHELRMLFVALQSHAKNPLAPK